MFNLPCINYSTEYPNCQYSKWDRLKEELLFVCFATVYCNLVSQTSDTATNEPVGVLISGFKDAVVLGKVGGTIQLLADSLTQPAIHLFSLPPEKKFQEYYLENILKSAALQACPQPPSLRPPILFLPSFGIPS